jgi:hypothetical protein
LIAVTIVLAVMVGLAAHRWWTTPKVVRNGAVVLAVDRHFVMEDVAGVGLVGTLGLVGGRCVGTVGTNSAGRS